MSNALFRNGDRVPEDGLYRVLHQQHALPREVTLVSGQPFPCCAGCSDEVGFQLIHPLTLPNGRGSFRIMLNQLPILATDKADDRPKAA